MVVGVRDAGILQKLSRTCTRDACGEVKASPAPHASGFAVRRVCGQTNRSLSGQPARRGGNGVRHRNGQGNGASHQQQAQSPKPRVKSLGKARGERWVVRDVIIRGLGIQAHGIIHTGVTKRVLGWCMAHENRGGSNYSDRLEDAWSGDRNRGRMWRSRNGTAKPAAKTHGWPAAPSGPLCARDRQSGRQCLDGQRYDATSGVERGEATWEYLVPELFQHDYAPHGPAASGEPMR